MKPWITKLCLTSLLAASGAMFTLQPQTVLADMTAAYTTQWQAQTNQYVFGSTVFGADGTLFVASAHAPTMSPAFDIRAYDMKGSLLWQTDADYFNDTPLMLAPSTTTLGGVWVGNGKQVQLLNGKGQVQTTIQTDENVSHVTEAANGLLFVSTAYTLTAYNQGGDKQWSVPLPGLAALDPVQIQTQANGSILCLSSHWDADAKQIDNQLLTLNPDGSQAAEYTWQTPLGSQSTLDASGNIYTMSQNPDDGVWILKEVSSDGHLISEGVPNIEGTLNDLFVAANGNVEAVTSDAATKTVQLYATGVGTDLYSFNKFTSLTDHMLVGDGAGLTVAHAADGTFYLPIANSKHPGDTKLEAYSPKGQLLWSTPTVAIEGLSSGPAGELAVVGDTKVTAFSDAHLASGSIAVLVNGKIVSFPDAKPYINSENRTMVPLRFIADQLGAQVDWHADTQTVVLSLSGHEVDLKVGDTAATVDGQTVTFDSAAVIQDSRTFVPLRFIAEAFGAKVDWNANTHQVLIQTGQ